MGAQGTLTHQTTYTPGRRLCTSPQPFEPRVVHKGAPGEGGESSRAAELSSWVQRGWKKVLAQPLLFGEVRLGGWGSPE